MRSSCVLTPAPHPRAPVCAQMFSMAHILKTVFMFCVATMVGAVPETIAGKVAALNFQVDKMLEGMAKHVEADKLKAKPDRIDVAAMIAAEAAAKAAFADEMSFTADMLLEGMNKHVKAEDVGEKMYSNDCNGMELRCSAFLNAMSLSTRAGKTACWQVCKTILDNSDTAALQFQQGACVQSWTC